MSLLTDTPGAGTIWRAAPVATYALTGTPITSRWIIIFDCSDRKEYFRRIDGILSLSLDGGNAGLKFTTVELRSKCLAFAFRRRIRRRPTPVDAISPEARLTGTPSVIDTLIRAAALHHKDPMPAVLTRRSPRPDAAEVAM